jgi:hypothetical protein
MAIPLFLMLLCQLGIACVLARDVTPIKCAGDIDGVRIHMPVNEFARAYTNTFRMSDGSVMVDSQDSDLEHMDAAFHHMKTLMVSIGATKYIPTGSNQTYVNVGHTVDICGSNMTRILMLAVLGNFVSSPVDPKYSSQSSEETLATVVVDYTGSLVVVHSFATMRTYFLELLLFISIVSIARLSLVKKVVYKP